MPTPRRKPRRSAPQTRRCKYVAPDGARCSRIATIDGELCQRCAEQLEDELGDDAVWSGLANGTISLGDVISRAAGNLVENLFGQSPLWQDLSHAARQAAAHAQQQQRQTGPHPRAGSSPGSRPRPGSRPGSQADPRDLKLAQLRAARTLLGFSPTQVLTVEAVSDRRKALARTYHPDRPGGSTAKMQRINAAADLLISELSKPMGNRP